MNCLRGNREHWVVFSVSLAAISAAFAVSLVRRRREAHAAPQSLDQADRLQQATHRDTTQGEEHEREHIADEAGADESSAASTAVVEGMRDVVSSREQVNRGVKNRVVAPVGDRVFGVLCSAVMFYLGTKQHLYAAVLVLATAIMFQLKATELTAGNHPTLPTGSKLEILRGLDRDALNELMRDDLPRWVKFPDVEKCEWLNLVVAKMWPYVKVVVARSLKEALVAELELVKPTVGMTEVGIRSLNFGTAAPKLNGIKCLEGASDEQVTLDVDLLVVTQNSDVVLSFGNPLLHAAVNVEISDIVLRGTLRVELKPLFPWWPTFGAVVVSFIESPTIDFQLKTLHINIMDLPALSPILHKVINSAVEKRCLWPNKVLIPLVDDRSILEMGALTANHPLGILVIRGLKVRGVCPSRTLSRWSGVFSFRVNISVGKESIASEAIHGQSSFDFSGEAYKLLVLDPQTQDLSVSLESSEAFQPRKRIDTAWVHLGHLKPQIGCEENLSFGCGSDRRAELELVWYPFTRRGSSGHDDDEAALPDDVARMGAIIIRLLRCERLASMDINGTSDPYVVFRVGSCCQQSSVKHHALNPIWDPPECFELLVNDYQHDELSVVVMDSDLLKTDDTVGRVQIALEPVRRALQYSDTWLLEGNCGSVTLEMEWRGF